MDINEIRSTIAELENSDTTYENCHKLASLYVIDTIYSKREENATERNLTHLTANYERDTEKELNDLFPYYEKYAETKRKYCLGYAPESLLQRDMLNLCEEISEFLHILYINTYTDKEREAIKSIITDFERTH